jgi:WD repeat-containing protein 19
MVAETALNALDLKIAKRLYRQNLADAGMVMTISRIETIEDKNELLGHVATIFSDFDLAQQYFLSSQNPKEALFL